MQALHAAMRPLGHALLALLWLAACSTAAPQPGATTTSVDAPQATAAPSASQPQPKPVGSAPRLFVRLDPAYRACATDGDCQLIADCACKRCIPSKQMHAQPCPNACATDACAGRKARCVSRVCASDGAYEPAPSQAVFDAVSAAGQVLLDDARLEAYFHEKDRPERVPLVVAWEPGLAAPRWNKFGRPVQFFPGVPEGPHLLPVSVDIYEAAATFELFYPPEGLRIAAQLWKTNGRWEIDTLELRER